MNKTNVKTKPSTTHRHDTPNNKTHIIKFRVTAEEKASLELTCKLLNLSLSTFIRRAIHNVKIEKTVIVAGGGEETLTAVSTLLAQCSKVGTNLNQLARHFNSGGVVRVFRGDMLERCHTVHPELSRRAAEMRSGLQVRQGVSPGSVRCLHRRI